MTFGAGINKLAGLRSLGAGDRGLDKESRDKMVSFLERDPVRVVSLCLLAAAAVGTWLWHLRVTEQVSTRQLWLIPIAWLGTPLLLGAMIEGGTRLLRHTGRARPRLEKAFILVFSLTFIALIIGVIATAEVTRTRMEPFFALFFILLTLLGALRSTLSPSFQQRLLRIVHPPPGIEEWLDYWASADPVPNGPTRTADPQLPVSTKIWNEASLLRDHTSYWKNRDGFTLPVVRTLARVARSAWHGLLAEEDAIALARSGWRTAWLRVARWLVPASFVPFALYTSRELEEIWRNNVNALRPFGVADWLPRAPLPWASAFRWGVVGLAAWSGYMIVLGVWRWWARTEQDQVLDHGCPRGITTGLVAFGVTLALVTAGALQLAAVDLTSPLPWNGSEVPDVYFWLAVGLWSLVLVWLATKAFPPPGTRAKR